MIMTEQHASSHQLLKSTERFLGYATAVVVGVILMIAGLSMGVSLVLLPIGVPVGLAGILLFMWGMFHTTQRKQT
jgi:hypothetical protein